mgnify:CR=1 FL=1|jgi:D-glycero-D-manno-heptose 1,7-bisphosphate phosphatase
MKNLFLDRDGIINEVIIRNNKVSSPRTFEEFKIRDEFKLFYDQIKSLNLNIFVVSNQPDIARSLMDKKVLEKIDKKLFKHFNFTEICYCTHDDKDHCPCRKPKPGLVLNLLHKYNLNKGDSFLIGDSHKDIFAGNNAGIKTVLLKTSYNKNNECFPDFTITSFLNIMGTLIKKGI